MVFADVFSITQDTLYTAKAKFISFHGSISLLVECRDNFLDGVVVGVHLEDQPDTGGAGRINDKVLCFVKILFCLKQLLGGKISVFNKLV